MVVAGQRWRALPPADRRLAAALVALLPAVAAGLRVLGFGRLCRVLSRVSPSPPAAAPFAIQAALALGRLVNAVAWRLPGRPACLTRSVTLWWLLRRRGIDAAVRIGVRRTDGRLEAHAWVEIDGLVLNDAQDVGSRFAAFEGDTLPASWTSS
jgi:hypothetical protein